jgi:IS1 family transposase
MNILKPDKQVHVIAALVEGNSIRATVRMTRVAKNTVIKLLVAIGKACDKYQDEVFHNLTCKRVQCDEIWSFCHAKEKNVPKNHKGELGYGDVWTWTAIDADTKLVFSWLIGDRSGAAAMDFMVDIQARVKNRMQLTTDGHKMYLDVVEDVFNGKIDYAMLVKIYGSDPDDHRRYSPPVCTSAKKTMVCGNPDMKHVSTSYVERQNLTMRMSMRRFTRLTNGFSKKVENLFCAVSLHFMYYNFCRIHQTLRVTPAMAAGVTDHVWEIKDILAIMVTD